MPKYATKDNIFTVKVHKAGNQHKTTFPKPLMAFKKPVKGGWKFNPKTRELSFWIEKQKDLTFEHIDIVIDALVEAKEEGTRSISNILGKRRGKHKKKPKEAKSD